MIHCGGQRALGWTTLEKRQCLVHRCLSDEAPSFLCSKFRPNTSLGYIYIRTRGAKNMHLPRPKTEYFRLTFRFQRALIYNHAATRNQTNAQTNQKFQHDHLLNQHFHTHYCILLSHQVCITLYTTNHSLLCLFLCVRICMKIC